MYYAFDFLYQIMESSFCTKTFAQVGLPIVFCDTMIAAKLKIKICTKKEKVKTKKRKQNETKPTSETNLNRIIIRSSGISKLEIMFLNVGK